MELAHSTQKGTSPFPKTASGGRKQRKAGEGRWPADPQLDVLHFPKIIQTDADKNIWLAETRMCCILMEI